MAYIKIKNNDWYGDWAAAQKRDVRYGEDGLTGTGAAGAAGAAGAGALSRLLFFLAIRPLRDRMRAPLSVVFWKNRWGGKHYWRLADLFPNWRKV